MVQCGRVHGRGPGASALSHPTFELRSGGQLTRGDECEPAGGFQHDYLPYGAEIASGQAGRPAADHLSPRFTGQERDGETVPNLDYFGARYYSAEQGRFLSPDPANAGADLFHPQSWHAYSYAWNSPLVNTDPSGADTCPDGSSADACVVDSADPVAVDNCWYCFAGGGGDTSSGSPSMQPPAPVQTLWHNLGTWLTAPRDPNCVQGAAVAGAAAGAAGGAILGGVGGGAAGGTLGSVVPVAGNLLGAAGGAELGADGGAAIGGGLGYLGGFVGGYLTCASSIGSGGGGAGTHAASEYTDVTDKHARIPNRQTDVTPDDLGRNLEANGFTKSTASDGTPIYTKGDTAYTVYSRANSTQGPTAQVKVNGEVVLKLRLK